MNELVVFNVLGIGLKILVLGVRLNDNLNVSKKHIKLLSVLYVSDL